MRPRLSIVIPVFNTPLTYVAECLSSVVAQTSRDITELLVFDDGSSPEYKRRLKQLVGQIENEVSVLFAETHENRGLCYARNDAIEMASGEYVLLLDSDDVLDPTIVEKCANTFESGPVFVYTNHAKVSADRRSMIHERDKRGYHRLMQEFDGTVFDPLLHATFIFHAQVMRRDAFLQLGGFRTDLLYGDEVDMHLRIGELSSGARFELVPETLYHYRDNPYSIVHQPDLYTKLITNIERIIVEAAQRRGFDIVAASRMGRALRTHAAHYALFLSLIHI